MIRGLIKERNGKTHYARDHTGLGTAKDSSDMQDADACAYSRNASTAFNIFQPPPSQGESVYNNAPPLLLNTTFTAPSIFLSEH